jgi:hypothetical protein
MGARVFEDVSFGLINRVREVVRDCDYCLIIIKRAKDDMTSIVRLREIANENTIVIYNDLMNERENLEKFVLFELTNKLRNAILRWIWRNLGLNEMDVSGMIIELINRLIKHVLDHGKPNILLILDNVPFSKDTLELINTLLESLFEKFSNFRIYVIMSINAEEFGFGELIWKLYDEFGALKHYYFLIINNESTTNLPYLKPNPQGG